MFLHELTNWNNANCHCVSGCKPQFIGEICYLHFTLCIKLLGTELSTAAVEKYCQY